MAIPSLPISRRRNVWRDPFAGMTSLHSELNELFEDLFERWGLRPYAEMQGRAAALQFRPSIDVSETKDAVKISVELPGMDAKDIDLHVDDQTLVISGEKKEETQEEGETTFARETAYGAFRRELSLPCKIDEEKVTATFDHGVLRINLPKAPGEESAHGKKIEIQAA